MSRVVSPFLDLCLEEVIALLTAKEIFDLVRDDLVLVEEELARQSAVAFAPVSELTSYLLGGGGKRLRPALLLLCNGYAAGKRSTGAIRLAAVVELLLKRGSQTNLPDDPPWATPLAWATRRGHGEIAEVLTRHGAT